jgi:YidC/Oxa1 family membrane protein insertase
MIGALLIPALSAGSQVLQMWISQKTNNSVITDKNGVQDEETAKNSQTAQQSKMMMWMMPLMSLWIGFTVPAGLSLYWFVGGVVRTVEDTILTRHYRKVYDAEDAERLARYQAQEALEAEKERIRAERRAANPDGITANTSKKKLQQKQKEEEAAARAAAEAEYLAKKGVVAEPAEEKKTLSGIADRPNCKGRAYDPNRYNSTEEE